MNRNMDVPLEEEKLSSQNQLIVSEIIKISKCFILIWLQHFTSEPYLRRGYATAIFEGRNRGISVNYFMYNSSDRQPNSLYSMNDCNFHTSFINKKPLIPKSDSMSVIQKVLQTKNIFGSELLNSEHIV